jgi:Raf kinase inhibitor-like YbhB/YbcL family protein
VTTLRRAARTATVLAVAVLAVGCGLVGGPQAALQHAPVITVTSAMMDQGAMSDRYTCASAHPQSPPLAWSGIPSRAKSVALVVDDASAPITPRIYWIVFNISPATIDIQADTLPTGARQARNSTGQVGYDAPCPPRGGTHQYRFTIYALNMVLRLPAGTSVRSAWEAIARHAIARGRLPETARSETAQP